MIAPMGPNPTSATIIEAIARPFIGWLTKMGCPYGVCPTTGCCPYPACPYPGYVCPYVGGVEYVGASYPVGPTGDGGAGGCSRVGSDHSAGDGGLVIVSPG